MGPTASRSMWAYPSAKRQKCAAVGCNFQVTWHASHCCSACAGGAPHGPRCEKLEMPKRCATEGCAFEATWHPQYCCHACADGKGHGGKCEQRLASADETASGGIDRSRFYLPGRQLLAECKPNVDGVTFTNLQFAEAQVWGVSVPLCLDLLLPSAEPRSFPCVIFCHGGSWQRGNHKHFLHSQWRDFLLSLGWAVASTQYRFLQEAKLPACEADLRCAVRMLRLHAHDFRLKPDMLVAMGHSAGGHLVSLLPAADVALDGDMRHLAPEVSCRPDALICFAPALKGPRKQIGAFDVVNHTWPPSLVLHGTKDHLLDAETSQEFVEKLQSLEVPAQMVLLEGHGHEVNPPPPEALAAVRDFLLQQNG